MKKKYKVTLIIFGIILFLSVVGDFSDSFLFEYSRKPIYSSDVLDVVWVKNTMQLSAYMVNEFPEESNSILNTSNALLVDYDDMKFVYETVEAIRKPVPKGIYIIYAKEKKEIIIINIQYNPTLLKIKGKCVETVSLEDCWGYYYDFY